MDKAKKRQYDINYAKEKLKRISLNVQKTKYIEIKRAADRANRSVNGFIKDAIEEKIHHKSMWEPPRRVMEGIKREWEKGKEEGAAVKLSDVYAYSEKQYQQKRKEYSGNARRPPLDAPWSLETELESIETELEDNDLFSKKQFIYLVDVQRAIKAEIKKMFSNPMSEINVKVFEKLTEELEGIRIELEEAVQEIDWYKQHFDHILELLEGTVWGADEEDSE